MSTEKTETEQMLTLDQLLVDEFEASVEDVAAKMTALKARGIDAAFGIDANQHPAKVVNLKVSKVLKQSKADPITPASAANPA